MISNHERVVSLVPASRREFLKASAAATVGASVFGGLNIARAAHAQGSDVIKIALIGCGGRGTGAAAQALETKANVKLIAVADAFRDSVDRCCGSIAAQYKDRVDVPEERKFVGLDAYKKALETDAAVVLMCSPPGFRPVQFEAAVKAGKHVFMEKPLAVDAPGIRRIIAANEEAKRKSLAVAVGFHMRHEASRVEAVKMLHQGAIGEIRFLRAYFNSYGVWVRPRQPGQTEMQYQVRNWYYFNWLSGDHIVEQHVHDLDMCNWIKQAHPIEANGMGGRQVRKGKDHGEIFDHHSVEFTYADGAKLFSYCRHIPNCWDSFAEYAHGTKGQAEFIGHSRITLSPNGRAASRWKRGEDGHQTEQDHLFAALLAGQPHNEVDSAAESSLTAIMGRMATYSGKVVQWEQAMNSPVDLAPKSYDWDATPPVLPDKDGCYACAIPGVTKAY
jgi:myo-inositol 2-dehydrogenase / D-chiro-inositol 1-dehydrogenase